MVWLVDIVAPQHFMKIIFDKIFGLSSKLDIVALAHSNIINGRSYLTDSSKLCFSLINQLVPNFLLKSIKWCSNH